MLTPEEIDRLISCPHENEHLEFKEAKNQFDFDKLCRYCAAIGNEGGGELLLGITDKHPRQVVGTSSFPNIEKTQSQIFAKLKFRVIANAIDHPQGRVVHFKIPGRPRGTAFSCDGAYFMRVGENLLPMSEDQLRNIFSEGKPEYLLEIAKSHVEPDQIVSLLNTQVYFDLMQIPYPATRDAVFERLAQDQILLRTGGAWNITNLGAMLFANNLYDFEPPHRKSPRIIIYNGKNKLLTQKDNIFSLGYAVGFESLIKYINSQLPANEVIGQALRSDIRMFPEIAIRELVANALVHQDLKDYSSFILIEIYDDRIEISNPGRPLIPGDRFIDEYKSRNELLTDIMRRFRICEEKSSGIDKVIASVEVCQLPAPDFKISPHHTTVVLFAHKPFEDMDRKERVRACYQHACLLYVSNQKMTNQTLRERFKLPESKSDIISKIIADTVSDGKLKIDNPENKSRRYAKYVPYWG